MSNSIGTEYRFTIWGQSHAPAIGVTIAENLGGYLASKGNKVIISHRDINK